MATKPKSLSERRQEAGLPVRASTAEISEMGTVTFLSAELAEARNPQTGTMGEGMLVTLTDGDGRSFQSFIGGVALVRTLKEMLEANAFPFTARIVRDGEGPGHPWTFAD
jgi:hypothetical protein